MGGDAVELVVRFADTLLSVSRVRQGERYVIGTARDVDLALDLAPLIAFPLVESTARGFVLRLPVGVRATSRGAVIEDRELVLPRNTQVAVALGKVTIAITRVAETPVVVPRPSASRRIVPYPESSPMTPASMASATRRLGSPVLMPTMTPRRLPAGRASTISQVWRYLRVGESLSESQTRLPGSQQPSIEPVLGQAAVMTPPLSSSMSARKRL